MDNQTVQATNEGHTDHQKLLSTNAALELHHQTVQVTNEAQVDHQHVLSTNEALKCGHHIQASLPSHLRCPPCPPVQFAGIWAVYPLAHARSSQEWHQSWIRLGSNG